MVSRSEADGRGGYSWSVTFLKYMGDVPALVADSDLTGYSATVSVVEVRVVTVEKWSRALPSQRQVLCKLLIALFGRVVFVRGGLAAWNVFFLWFSSSVTDSNSTGSAATR